MIAGIRNIVEFRHKFVEEVEMSENALVFVDYSYNRYSLAVLTGVLEEDHRFHDLDIKFLKHQELDSNIAELSKFYKKLVVGFSFHTPNLIEVAKIVSGLKSSLKQNSIHNVLLVAGGPHPSGDPLGTLEIGVDAVVIGEGEVTFPSLLEKFLNDLDFQDVKGISYFSGDDYRYTGRPIPIDLSDYAAFAPKHRRFSPIEISRGCPWGCKFCQTPFLMGGKMRHRSIDSIVKYAKIAKENGLRDLRFITPVSFAYGSPDGKTIRLDILEDMLKAVGEVYGKDHVFLGSFPSEVRPENITPESLELVKKYCANDNIIIGAQSGSASLLDSIHRGHGVDEVITATRLIIESGLIANIDFIFGMPGETQEDINQTLALMQELTGMGARVHSHTFMPLVGTPFSKGAPGTVDPKTRQLLENLRGRGLEYGDWKKQETIAEESTEYIKEQVEKRPEKLKVISPLRPQ